MNPNEIKDGGPAFPEIDTAIYPPSGGAGMYPRVKSVGGMSLRDWFAGMALQGILATSDVWSNGCDKTKEMVSWQSFQIADAMLKAREGKD